MSGNRLPGVRIPSVVAGQSGPEDVSQESIVVELPPSNKFAIEWPAESSVTGPVHLPVIDRPVTFSSSEGETEISEEERNSAPVKPTTRAAEDSSDAEFITPTSNMDSDNNPMEQAVSSTLPKLSRAFSMPLPSQLGNLQNPHRTSSTSDSSTSTESASLERYHELSLELADSVQMVIQTLLQLSPPQVLDPAKEQFSACSLSIPTPSMSAMFTSMKNLNYMSANMSTFSSDHQTPFAPHPKHGTSAHSHPDFDIGEMVQCVGDALSGIAAQAGVDLVLYHGDVGMKHVSVKGDESGISFTLSHIIRQVISVCERGDAIEIGLWTDPPVRDEHDPGAIRSTPSPNLDTAHRYAFHIAHRYRLTEARGEAPQRSEPQFNSLILRRLLRHLGASFERKAKPRVPQLIGRSCELTLVLENGEASVLNPQGTATPEDATLAGYPEYRITHEPSLEQLMSFAETLRGKKATLHAHPRGSFAHHLSSYLTAWGMDVSHVSTEPDSEGERLEVPVDPLTPTPAPSTPETTVPPSPAPKVPPASTGSFTFILIDDDVNVLRNRLDKIKADLVLPLNLGRKRPSLATNHRPRSSPQVTRFMGSLANPVSSIQTQFVIVHFTSLANYKLVKDAIQSSLANFTSMGLRIPEVIVIPKPAGPRRFLTALHTAATKPVVDPFFVPIATSPISPGLHGISPLFSIANPARSPGSRSTGCGRTPSDRSTKSPKDPKDVHPYAPSSPLAGTDGVEYFSDAVVKLGTSPSTGTVISSPDGQPAGIVFQPSAKRVASSATVSGHPTHSPRVEREHPAEATPRARGGSFRGPVERNNPFTQGFSEIRGSPRPSMTLNSDHPSSASLKGKAVATPNEESLSVSGEQSAPSPSIPGVAGPSGTSRPPRRPSQQTASPIPPSTLPRVSPGLSNPTTRKPLQHPFMKGKAPPGVVPPISVLIVDDNPINQTILSTFMKRKKVKYDVAKDGDEAVEKWKSGNFHLILMDIQMPVMDGIQATKEIRRIESRRNTSQWSPFDQRTPSDGSSSTGDNRCASVIIVALTASSLQADRVAALAAGCNDFLTKPVSLQWLESKIIEWGSIKALQMWSDIRPEVVRNFSRGQDQQTQNVARRLHVPEGRSTPTTGTRSRSSSMSRRSSHNEGSRIVQGLAAAERLASPTNPTHQSDNSPGTSTGSTGDRHGVDPMTKASITQPIASDTAPIHGTHDDREDVLAAGRSGPFQPPGTNDDGVEEHGQEASLPGPVPFDDNPERPPPEPH